MQEPASPLTLQAVPAAPDKSAAPAQAARDVTAHLAAFREFLNASWSCFSALRTQSVWEDNHTLIREFLQANWRVLVESQLLPSGGRLPRYFTCLRPRGPAASEEHPTHYIKCEMPGSKFDLVDRRVALLGIVNRLDTGSGVYPPFDHVEMYPVETSKVLIAPFHMVRFILAELPADMG